MFSVIFLPCTIHVLDILTLQSDKSSLLLSSRKGKGGGLVLIRMIDICLEYIDVTVFLGLYFFSEYMSEAKNTCTCNDKFCISSEFREDLDLTLLYPPPKFAGVYSDPYVRPFIRPSVRPSVRPHL